MPCDACIIGAGIAGLSVAYELATAGQHVVVIDADIPGAGETGRTTAHLMTAYDDRYCSIERYLGPEAAKLVAQSHVAAIQRIEQICRDESIDCGFERVDGYLFAPSREEGGVLKDELEAAHKAGLSQVEWIDDVATGKTTVGPALRFPMQGQLHPLLYLEGLIESILQRGGKVYGRTRAIGVEDGKPGTIRTDVGHTIQAASIIVATNTPFNDRFAIHTKQAGYRTYVIGMKVPRGSMPNCQFWDTMDPYHYVRIAGEFDVGHLLLIVGAKTTRLAKPTTRRLASTGYASGRERGSLLSMIRSSPGLDR